MNVVVNGRKEEPASPTNQDQLQSKIDKALKEEVVGFSTLLLLLSFCFFSRVHDTLHFEL